MRSLGPLVALLLLTGCVSAFPEAATRSANRALTVGVLRSDPEAHRDARVILGGEILETRPRRGETEVEVLSRRLRGGDRPEISDRSEGRFLVLTSEFLDPAVYAKGRRITVLGTVVGGEERPIGEVPYRYPVIRAERIRLWPPEIVGPPRFHPAYPWGYYDWLLYRPPSSYYRLYPYRYDLGPPGPWPHWDW